MRNRMALLAAACCVALTEIAAVVPTTMNYQGRLTDNSPLQEPVTATLPMDFSIWSAPVGGAQLWAESWAAVEVQGGIFSVLLGSNGVPIPSSVFTAGAARWLEVVVAGETLDPRQQLGAVGWAHKALEADDAGSLGGLPSSSFQQRVTGTCPAGASIRIVDASGNVTCETDTVGITVESDPQVGSSSTNAVPIWDGTKLVDADLWQVGGNVGIGDSTPDDDLHVFRPDNDVASISAMGSSQGSGRVYVGESPTTGGGISFDGDGVPDIAGGTNRVTLFRRSGGADSEVLSYGAASNDVMLSGALIIDGNQVIDDGASWHRSYGASGWYNGTYGGGIYMADSSWVRVYGGKDFSTESGDLDVGGTAFVGHQIVSASYEVSTSVSSCHSHGGLQCYTGSGSVSCPAGKVLLGGGCLATTAANFGAISASYPSGSTWFCASSYDISGGLDTVYAICARLGN